MALTTVNTEYPQWHHCSNPCVCLWVDGRETLKGSKEHGDKENIGMQRSPSSSYSDWHAYVWGNDMCVQVSIGKDLFERFLFCVVSILHLHPEKGTAADMGSYCMLSNFLFPSNNWLVFFFSKQSIHKHQRRSWASLPAYHFLPHPPSLLTLPQFPLVLLISEFFPYHQVKKGLLLWKLCV